MVQLREFLHLIDRPEKVLPDKVYRQVGVRVWGKGAYERESILGCNTKYKEFSKACANDIIVNKIWARNGSVAIVTAELDGCYCSSEFPLFVVDEKKACLGWVKWLIKTPWFWKQCMEKSGGTSGKNRITPYHFLEINVELPPLDMQTKAFHRLDNSAPSISELELINKETIMLIQDLRQSILQEAVSGKLVPQDPNDEPASVPLDKVEAETGKNYVITDAPTRNRLPTGWIWVRFGRIIHLRHGHQFMQHDFVDAGIPVIKIGQCKAGVGLDLSNCNYISESRLEEFSDYLIRKGDLLMALTGGTLGKVTVVDKDYGNVLQNYRVGHFSPIREDVIAKDFVILILRSSVFQELVSGKVNENAQPNIGKENIDNLYVPLPPLNEQKRIVEKVDQLMKLCDRLEETIKANERNSDLLMEAVLREAFAS